MPTMVLKDGRRIGFREGLDPNDVYKRFMAQETATRQSSPEYQAKVAAQQASDARDYNPTNEMGANERRWAGAQRGVADVARNIGNMAGLVSDEDMAARAKLDAPLLATAHGRQGNFVGNTAALTALTAPLGGVGATGGLARTLGRGALQGAVGGAVNANPNERGSGALLGGATGGLLTGALAGGGRLVRGLARKSPDALALEQAVGGEIPLQESLDETHPFSSTLKRLYGLAANAPVSKQILAKQKSLFTNRYIGKVGQEAIPPTTGLKLKFTEGGNPAENAVNLGNVQTVKDAMQTIMGPVKSIEVQIGGAAKTIQPKGQPKVFATAWGSTVGKALSNLRSRNATVAQEVSQVIDKHLSPTGKTGTLEGVLNAISDLKTLRNEAGGSANVQGAGGAIDDIIESLKDLGRARLTKQNKALLPNWEQSIKLQDELWPWMNMERAVGADLSGAITTGALRSGMRGGLGSRATGRIPQQEIISRADDVLNRSAAHAGGAFQTNLALGGAGGTLGFFLGGGPVGSVLGAAAPFAAFTGLASRGVQRALTGDTAKQKAIAALLRANPNLGRNLATVGTAALIREGN